MNQVFNIVHPKGNPVPVLLSVPHAGTAFPPKEKALYKPELIVRPDDTDWFVDQLYDFAPEIGITMIVARYSRWLIDLNRDPQSKPLYEDGRMITGLTPIQDFKGNSIYREAEFEPDEAEVARRIQLYYQPYHDQIRQVLHSMQAAYGHVLFWDAHSIRRYVRSIQPGPFPDLTLGSNDEKSAHPRLIQQALHSLQSGPYSLTHNHPFKGGQLTRSFGQPGKGIHALQLEMAKELYMDDAELNYHPQRANQMRELLKRTLSDLIDELGNL